MVPERVRARLIYEKTEPGKQALKRARDKFILLNPQKHKAHLMVSNAVRDGRLVKLPCEVCGSVTRIHGHHDDYSKPLDVVWLCPRHHSQRHRELRACKFS